MSVDEDVTRFVFSGRTPAKEWPWTPSTNIRQAMMVADEIMRTGLNFKLYRNVQLPGEPRWYCTFSWLETGKGATGIRLYEAEADTAELAICLAAIRAADGDGRRAGL